MIYTCTTNPSLDYFLKLSNFKPGKNNRSEEEYYEAGGKGVNVSIVLSNLNIPSIALGFLGGFTKDLYLSLLKKYWNLQPLFTTIAENTRINCKVVAEEESAINALGPHISDEEYNKFYKRVSGIYEGDYFVLSGYIQEDLRDRMRDLVNELVEKGVNVIVDADKAFMSTIKNTEVFLAKLDEDDIAATSKDEIIKVGREMLKNGAKHVIYSSPNSDAYLFTEDSYLVCKGRATNSVNTTGHSDTIIAGYIYSVLRGADNLESFRYANAASNLAILSNDMVSRDEIEKLSNTISIKKEAY